MIRLGPQDPLPLSSRPLDVHPYSKPYARIVRYTRSRGASQIRGYVDLPETLRGMAEGQVILVRTRFNKDLPRIVAAAKKANIRIETDCHPETDSILVTSLGEAGEPKAVKAASEQKAVKAPAGTPQSRCFKGWKKAELLS